MKTPHLGHLGFDTAVRLGQALAFGHSENGVVSANISVLKRLQTRFVFALEKDQLSRIQGVLADLDEKIVRQLPKLPRGVCAVSGSTDVIRHGFLLAVRQRATPVGGRTPPVFQGRVKKSWRNNHEQQ